MKHVEIFTDGACKGNPGKGGWGALLRYNNTVKELSGCDKMTTNNKMELTAVVESLWTLKEPCKVTLTTDSQYVIDCINKGWVWMWKNNNWLTTSRRPVANRDLWEKVLLMLDVHDVRFIWVKGHSGHPENERCDYLAVEAYRKMKR